LEVTAEVEFFRKPNLFHEFLHVADHDHRPFVFLDGFRDRRQVAEVDVVELADIDSDLTAVGGLSPAFIEEATYDPAANSWDIRFEGERSLADLLKVQAG
jgi:hypothetical protein